MAVTRPKSHYLFIALVLIFIILLVTNVLPFPILIGLLLISWCGLALIVMLWGRLRQKRPD